MTLGLHGSTIDSSCIDFLLVFNVLLGNANSYTIIESLDKFFVTNFLKMSPLKC